MPFDDDLKNHIFNFVKHHTTLKQARKAQKLLDKPDLLLIYILSAYNMHEITQFGGMRMITNPEAFLPTKTEKNAFIKKKKKYVINLYTYNGKEVNFNGYNSNRPNSQTAEDRNE